MTVVYPLLVTVTFFLYAASAALFALFFLTQNRTTATIAFSGCLAGLCLHTCSIALRAVALGYPPLSNLHESLVFFAWVVALAYTVVELRQKNRVNGTFVMPLAAALTGYAALVDTGARQLVPALRSPWLGIHASACLLGYGCFLMAFCFGVMYLWQEREVKSRRIDSFFFRLPSLGLVDRLGYKSIGFGFVFLSFGIVSGSLWAHRAWGSYWSWDPKETASLIIWMVYVVYLHGRAAFGWRGRKSAYIAVAGFLCVLVTYFGVSYLLPGLHAYF